MVFLFILKVIKQVFHKYVRFSQFDLKFPFIVKIFKILNKFYLYIFRSEIFLQLISSPHVECNGCLEWKY